MDKFKSGQKQREHVHGLILYYHPHSFYSQKVLFALYEKNVKFTTVEIDVPNCEHLMPWFLELNHKGEVPVLQDNTLIVPESSRIIEYLEDHFQGENVYRLIPKNLDEKIKEKLKYFCKIINRLPIGAISIGSLMHPEFSKTPKLPFIAAMRDSFLESDQQLSSSLRELAKINPNCKEMLLRKADYHDKKRILLRNREEYIKLLTVIDVTLNDIENELKLTNSINKWLFTNDFTLVDVCLGILLHRLSCLGLDHHYWLNNKKPYIENYYKRLQARETFSKAIPSQISLLKTMWQRTPRNYKLTIGVASFSSIFLTGFILHKFISQ